MFSDGFLNLMSKAEMKTSLSDVTVFEEQTFRHFEVCVYKVVNVSRKIVYIFKFVNVVKKNNNKLSISRLRRLMMCCACSQLVR